MGAEKIFVVGAGTMGSGISQTALQGGYQVYRYDTVAGAPEQAISGIESRLARSAEKGKISLDEKKSIKRTEKAFIATMKTVKISGLIPYLKEPARKPAIED